MGGAVRRLTATVPLFWPLFKVVSSSVEARLCTFFVLIGGGSTDANATDLMVASLNWQTARKGDNAGHMRDIGDSAGLPSLP